VGIIICIIGCWKGWREGRRMEEEEEEEEGGREGAEEEGGSGGCLMMPRDTRKWTLREC
jgi:hypothetical protein